MDAQVDTEDALTARIAGVARTPIDPSAWACMRADTYYFDSDVVQVWLDALDTSVELDETFEIDENTAPGTCFINSAEAGNGIRIRGDLVVSDTFDIDGNITASFASSSGSAPYYLRVDIDVGNVDFESDGDLDISAYCFGLDQAVTGTIHDLTVKLYLSPPSTSRTDFGLHHVDVDFGDIDLDSLSAPMSIYNLAATLFDNVLDTNTDLRGALEEAVEDALESSPIAGTVSDLADLAFALDSGYSSSTDTICSVDYDGWADCGGGACPKYEIR